MPGIIISIEQDGTAKVAVIEPTPEMLKDAQTYQSIEQAVEAVEEALGVPDEDNQQGAGAAGPGNGDDENAEGEGGGAAAGLPPGSGNPPQSAMDAMQMGYSRVNKPRPGMR